MAGPPLPSNTADSGPEPKRITLHLTRSSVAIGTVAIVTLIAAAFVAGRKLSTHPRPLTSIPTDDIQKGPVLRDVTNLQRTPVNPPPAGQNPPPPAQGGIGQQTPEQQQSPPQPPPSNIVRDANRRVGLNYVVVQSYPDQKMAEEAKKALTENGIDCTIEKNVPGMGKPDWFKVVGTDGFDRISNNPQLEAYKRRLNEISTKYARKNNFRAFDLTEYKWR
jgi:hypothetical protein